MTYIGATPTTGDFKLLDSITTSSTTTFNLRQGGVAVYPQSANHCLVVLNGVLQTAGSSFNIVNDTIVFASSLSSSDVINQILVLGNVNDIGVPSDSTVTDAKIVDMAASKLTGTVAQANIADQAINEAKLQISNAPTNGYMLTAQSGNTGGLTWAEASSGTHVKLLSGSASSAVNHDLVGFISSTYHCYLVLLSKVTGLQGNTLDFQFADGSGPFTGSNYFDAAHGFRSNSSDRFTQGGENSAQARLGSGLDASSIRTGSYFFYIYVNPNSAAFSCSASGHNWGYRADYGDYIHSDFTLGMDNSNTVTGFRVHAQGNDATTFDYQIYGIAK